jgi:Protein of unknown function (DUF3224)
VKLAVSARHSPVLGVIRPALFCLLLGVMSVGSVRADTATRAVGGSFTVSIDPNSISAQPVDGACHIKLTATFSFTGSLVGSFTAPFGIVHFGSCDNPAPEVFTARGAYTGSVLGKSGSFSSAFSGTIDAQGHARGDLVILQGRGGLAGLQGLLKLEGQSGVGGNYTGTATFGSWAIRRANPVRGATDPTPGRLLP